MDDVFRVGPMTQQALRKSQGVRQRVRHPGIQGRVRFPDRGIRRQSRLRSAVDSTNTCIPAVTTHTPRRCYTASPEIPEVAAAGTSSLIVGSISVRPRDNWSAR